MAKGQFGEIVEGWMFCGARLLQGRIERARAVAETENERALVGTMMSQFYEELDRETTQYARLGMDVTQNQIVLQEAREDRYSGPLLFERYQVLESVVPMGSYYLVDHNLKDLVVREGGPASNILRFPSIQEAENHINMLRGEPPTHTVPVEPDMSASAESAAPKVAKVKKSSSVTVPAGATLVSAKAIGGGGGGTGAKTKATSTPKAKEVRTLPPETEAVVSPGGAGQKAEVPKGRRFKVVKEPAPKAKAVPVPKATPVPKVAKGKPAPVKATPAPRGKAAKVTVAPVTKPAAKVTIAKVAPVIKPATKDKPPVVTVAKTSKKPLAKETKAAAVKAAQAVQKTPKATSTTTIADPLAAKKSYASYKPKASERFRELIMKGEKPDSEIFAIVKKEFKLTDDKAHYVQWYRSDMRRKGLNPPVVVPEKGRGKK